MSETDMSITAYYAVCLSSVSPKPKQYSNQLTCPCGQRCHTLLQDNIPHIATSAFDAESLKNSRFREICCLYGPSYRGQIIGRSYLSLKAGLPFVGLAFRRSRTAAGKSMLRCGVLCGVGGTEPACSMRLERWDGRTDPLPSSAKPRCIFGSCVEF